MKLVTRNVDPDNARDLLERVPRACISFAGDRGPRAEAIAFVLQGGRYLAGLPITADQWPRCGQEVALLIDEGIHWFDLRGILIRGIVKASEAPASPPKDLRWLEVVPDRTVAWDYGMLRVER